MIRLNHGASREKIMASFSVSNSALLRNYYKEYRPLVVKANRAEKKNGELSFADSMALRRAISKLGDYNYNDSTDEDLNQKIRGFCDAYNLTLDSSKGSATSSVKSAAKSMKNLSKEYQDELKKYGVSINDKGYMSLSETATKNISHEKFSKVFGKDSEYMDKLYTYAKRIHSKVDILL